MASSKLISGNRIFFFNKILFIVAFTFLIHDINAQVVGNPGSAQSAVQVCVPASYKITYTFEFISPANPTTNNRVLFRLVDIDDNSLVDFQNYSNIPLQTGSGPLFRKYIEQSHVFPLPVNGDCEYRVEIFFYYEGVIIPSAQQIQYVGNWHVDNEAGGAISITPTIKEVCQGDALLNFPFQDNSTFACVNPALHNPDVIERFVQFVYGTTPGGAASGIPNLSINVFGKTVVLTTATGASVPNSWTVNPINGANVLPYSTASGYFEGPVISTGSSPLGGSQSAFPISFNGVGTVQNDYFEVTVRNWNFCNQWNGVQPYPAGAGPNAAISKTATARIVIIGSPAAVAGTDRSICTGGSTQLGAAPVAGSTYSWSSSPAGFTSTLANPTVSPTVNTTYTVTETITATSCSKSNSVVVTVNPVSVGGSISPANTTVCTGTNSTLLTLSGYTGNIIKWQYSTNNWATTFDIVNTSDTYTATNLTTTTRYRAVIQSGVCGAVNSAVARVTVNPATAGGTISPAAATVCKGTNSTLLTLSGYTGSILNWQSSVDNWVTAVDISNTTTTLTATNLTTATKYRAVVQSGVCPSANSAVASIAVNPASVGGTLSGGSTPICLGSNTGVMTLSGYTGGIVQWQKRVNGGGWTVIANTNPTYSEVPSSSGTWEYTVRVTSSPCAASYSNYLSLVVNPLSVGGTVSSNQTICSGTQPADLTLNGKTGNVLNWEKSSNAAFTTPTIIAGTSTTLTGATIGNLTSNTYFRAVVQSGVCTAAYSSSVLVSIDPVTVGGTVNSDQSICSGTQPANLTLTGNTGNVLSWQKAADAAFTTPTTIPVTATTLSGATIGNLTSDTYFRAVIQSGVCPLAYSSAILVSVNPILPVSVSIAASANPVCTGTSVTFTATPVNGGTIPSYQWYRGAAPVGINSPTYTYVPLNGQVITVRMTSNATPCATGSPATSNAITMTVNPILPVSVSISASANPVCAGTPVTFTATPVNGGATPLYQWYNGAIPVGTNSPTYLYTPVNGDVISVVMTSTACTLGGPATSNLITMTVNPNPTALVLTGSMICVSPGSNGTITSGTSVAGVSYQLYNSANATVQAAKAGTGSGLTWSGLAAGNGYYVIATNAATCTATSTTVDITTTPNPIALVLTGSTICASPGGNGTITSGTSVAGVSYQLYNSANATVQVAQAGTGSGLTWSGLAAGNGYYVIATNAATCTATSTAVNVSTTPNPIALVLTGSTICVSPGSNGTITSGTSVAGVSYQLYNSANVTVQAAKAGTGSGLTWSGLAAGNGYYVIATNAATCTATSTAVNVSTTPNPTALVLTGSTICVSPGRNGTITSGTSVAGVSYQLYNSANATVQAAKAGTGSGLTWSGLAAGNGYYVIATNAATCTATSTTVDITTTPNPIALVLTGSTICASPGGNGTITSGTSVAGVSYQLYNSANATVQVAQAGTGSGLTWSGLAAGNGYYVIATNAATCTATSTAVNVSTTPNPIALVLTGSTICVSPGSNGTITSGTSVAGVSYQLYNSANVTVQAAKAGTGSGLTWSGLAAGNGYYVIATNAATCTATSTAVNVSTTPNPIALVLTGSTICVSPGSNGTITSGTSVAGVSYQLYNSANATVQAAKAGTGSGLTWSGLAAGNGYYVIATNAATCTATSTTVDITTTPNPIALVLTGSTICASPGGNGTITSGTSVAGVSYQLYNSANATVQVAQAGTGSGLTWSGLAAGNGYYVIATNAATCTATSTAVNVSTTPNPTALVLTGSTICVSPGGNGTITSGTSVAGVSYQLYNSANATVQVAQAGTGSGLTWSGLAAGNGYYVIATNAATCTATSTSVNVQTTVNPTALVLTGSIICVSPGNDGTITSGTSVAGVSYQLYNSANVTVQAAKAGTGSGLTWSGLAAGNGYYVIATNAATCTATSTTVDITTTPNPIALVLTGSTICASPGGNGTITSSTSVAGVTYQLYNSANATVAGSTGRNGIRTNVVGTCSREWLLCYSHECTSMYCYKLGC